jgi:RNA polymerase sigma-70 factor (ECF subfamily)
VVQPARAAVDLPTPAFPGLFEEQFDYVWNSLRRLGVPERDCEDLTHDVFVAVHRRLADYDPSRPLKPWLFGFAFRQASDYRRTGKNAREEPRGAPEAASSRPNAEEEAMANETRALVVEALGALDEDRRAVFVLHEIDDCPVPEIALVLELKLDTAYSRLRLAREDFRGAVRRIRARRGER